MGTSKFKSGEDLSKVFDCRYAKRGRCDGDCPLGVSQEDCEAAYFYGLEGRPALGTRLEIGDAVVETVETDDGDYEVRVQLSQREIAVLREFDWDRGRDFDPEGVRATQAEVDEHSDYLLHAGYMAVVDEGQWSTTEKGREQYKYWRGEA